jgi:hypothetical protein
MRKYTKRSLSRRRVIYRQGTYRAGRGHDHRITYRTQKSKPHFTASCSSLVLLPVLGDNRIHDKVNVPRIRLPTILTLLIVVFLSLPRLMPRRHLQTCDNLLFSKPYLLIIHYHLPVSPDAIQSLQLKVPVNTGYSKRSINFQKFIL